MKSEIGRAFGGVCEDEFQVDRSVNIQDYIMEGNNGRPISTRGFNKTLRKVHSEAKISTDNPSANTLRKTYVLRVYRIFEELKSMDPDGGLIDPLHITSKHMGHKSTE